MNNKSVLRVRSAEKRPLGSRSSNSRGEVGKFKDLRPSQILSVRKACDRFLESRGLKQISFGNFVLRKTENKGLTHRQPVPHTDA
jgi:hypothetical protein